MKKIYTIITGLALFAFVSPAYAAVVTPTLKISPSTTISPTINPSSLDQLNTLKEKLASQVAQMKLVEKRGILGVVSDSGNNQITITDIQGNTRFIDVDELTKFSSSTNKSFGFADITKGMKIGILGNYNKESKRLLARFITVPTVPSALSGAIVSLDSKNYYVHVATTTSSDVTVDIENSSKIYVFSKDGGLKKVGFSKIIPGARTFIIGVPDKKNPAMIIASTFYVLSDVPIDPSIKSIVPTTAVTTTIIPTPPTKKIIK